MTKVDEKAHVPAVDAAARERLREVLDRDGVVSAMLIGSQARGNPGPCPTSTSPTGTSRGWTPTMDGD